MVDLIKSSKKTYQVNFIKRFKKTCILQLMEELIQNSYGKRSSAEELKERHTPSERSALFSSYSHKKYKLLHEKFDYDLAV